MIEMSKKILVAFLLFQTAPVKAGFDPDFLASLARVNFSYRCQTWLKGEGSACIAQTRALVEALDFETGEDHQESIAFLVTRIREFARDPEVPALLKKVDFELQMLRQGVRKELDLYGMVHAFFAAKPWSSHPDLDAHTFFAAVIQDNARKYHVNWLRDTRRSGVSAEFAEGVSRIRDQLDAGAGNADFLSKVRLYPASVERLRGSFNGKIYYYYLPWVLSRELELRSGTAPELQRLSHALPLLISLIYKYHHYYKHHSDTQVTLGYRTFLLEPRPSGKIVNGRLVPALFTGSGEPDSGWFYRYRDLYMAYLGTINTSPRRGLPSNALGYPTFEKWIALDPIGSFSRIYPALGGLRRD